MLMVVASLGWATMVTPRCGARHVNVCINSIRLKISRGNGSGRGGGGVDGK